MRHPNEDDGLLGFFSGREGWLNMKKVWNEERKGWDIVLVIDGTYYPDPDSPFLRDGDVDAIVVSLRKEFTDAFKNDYRKWVAK